MHLTPSPHPNRQTHTYMHNIHTDRRNVATQRAQGYLDREGNPPPKAGYSKEAQLAFGQAVEVTQGMARELQRALKREHIEFIVAPYEADSQLAYLCMAGHVAGVITEDSDLVTYGASL